MEKEIINANTGSLLVIQMRIVASAGISFLAVSRVFSNCPLFSPLFSLLCLKYISDG